MRIKSQYVFVIVLIGLLVVAFTFGTLFIKGDKKSESEAKAKAPAAKMFTVQVRLTPEVARQYQVTLRGRTEAPRSVVIRSETAGTVAATPAVEGGFVRKGAILCRLNVDARQATLDQARAAMRSRQLQQKASAELAAKGYRSETQVLQDQANLDQATAAARQAEIALEQVNIRAPFDGVFDKRDAEIGAYLAPGQACGTLIELNPILLVGDVPELEAGRLKVGAAASAALTTGQTLNGRVRYVARDADPQTRTYRVEVVAGNPGMSARSGLSGTIRIGAGVGPAHLVPVSSLVLDSAGKQGIRTVNAANRVVFVPVSVLTETPDGIWISGLQGDARVITVGQSYVGEGQEVRVAVAR